MRRWTRSHSCGCPDGCPQQGLIAQVVLVWGLGGGVGVIGGGWIGQLLYNKNKAHMPLAMGIVTTTAVLPMLWVVNASLGTPLRLGVALACVFVSGLAASVAGPNVKCALHNLSYALAPASEIIHLPCGLAAVRGFTVNELS